MLAHAPELITDNECAIVNTASQGLCSTMKWSPFAPHFPAKRSRIMLRQVWAPVALSVFESLAAENPFEPLLLCPVSLSTFGYSALRTGGPHDIAINQGRWGGGCSFQMCGMLLCYSLVSRRAGGCCLAASDTRLPVSILVARTDCGAE